MNDERVIASIRRCCDGDGSMSDRIIKELEECARTDESTFLTAMGLMTAPGGHIQVTFLVPRCTLKEYHDFFIDDEGLRDAIVYAHKKHECLEETESEIIEKVSKEASEHILTAFSAVSKEVERLKKEFSKIGPELKFELPAVNEETEDNEKDFEYICDRCGIRVKTPNTLRGPVNVVDFYREVEDEVGDSVSYKLCQECMQDFFGFLSYN